VVAVLAQQVKQKQAVVVAEAAAVLAVAGEVVVAAAHKFLEHYHLGATQRVVGELILAQGVVVFIPLAVVVVVELVVVLVEAVEI
jgi:hypothetical protein